MARTLHPKLWIRLFAAAMLVACGGDSPLDPVLAAEVELSVPRAVLMEGESVQLSAIVKDESGGELKGLKVSWSSDRPDVARVDDTGVVTAVASGSATITAQVGNVAGRVTLAVFRTPASVTVTPDGVTSGTGVPLQMRALIRDVQGDSVANFPVAWSVADTTLARISSAGVLTGLKVGTVRVTAVAGPASGSAIISLGVPVGDVRITEPFGNWSMGIGDEKQFFARASEQVPAGARPPASGRIITWASSNPAVATISATGLVRAVGAGRSTITAISEGVSSGGTTVTVVGAVSAIVIDPGSATVVAGASIILGAIARDPAGNSVAGVRVTWSVSDSSRARVSGSANTPTATLVALAPGTVTVTAAAGEIRGSAIVTILPSVATVEVSPSTLGISVGVTRQLAAIVRDAAGNVITGRSVSWVSSNIEVATVTTTGVVTGTGVGVAEITAISEGKRGVATVTVAGIADDVQWSMISAGKDYSCAITRNGVGYCWGAGESGKLGTGSTASIRSPTRVAGGHTFRAIAAGDAHSCGVTVGGEAYCWGRNAAGELGSGIGGGESARPVRVAGGHTFVSVSTNGSHSCALTPDGEAWCWGLGHAGQLGDGTTGFADAPEHSPRPVRVRGGLTFRSVSTGSITTFGVTTDGRLFRWGFRPIFLGEEIYAPQLVPSSSTWETFSAGRRFGCGILEGGQISCIDPVAPPLGAGHPTYVQVTVGVDHVCALTGRGQAFCWGKNEQGQLGDGTFTASSDPVPVSGGATWVQLSAGWYHSCGVTSRGSAFCWGSNAAGQLAADGFSPSPSPVRIVVR